MVLLLLFLVVDRYGQLIVVTVAIGGEHRITDSTKDGRGSREAIVKTVIVDSVHAKQRAK